jgi:4-hydroxy-tetrahydrodipicolinate reductase
MKIGIIGKGRMGSLIKSTAENAGHEVLVMADIFNKEDLLKVKEELDVIIDFSHRDNLMWVLEAIQGTNIALIEGTTALTPEHMSALHEAGKTSPIFFSRNYSLGIAVLSKLAASAAAILKNDWDMEIIEKHHNKKADAPSGTAMALLESIDPDNEFNHVFGREGLCGARQKEIGIHAVRGGTLAGEHEILFLGPDESLSLDHNATSRQIFVNGALSAAAFMQDKPAGFYGMDELLAEKLQ